MGKRKGQEIQGQESRPAGLSGCAELPGDGRGR